jgi:hypothetical protein
VPVLKATNNILEHGQVESKLKVIDTTTEHDSCALRQQDVKKRRYLFNGSKLNESDVGHEELASNNCSIEQREHVASSTKVVKKDAKISSASHLPSRKAGIKAESVAVRITRSTCDTQKTGSHRKCMAFRGIKGKSLSIHEVSVSPEPSPAIKRRKLSKDKAAGDRSISQTRFANQDMETLNLFGDTFDDRDLDLSVKLYKSVKKAKHCRSKPCKKRTLIEHKHSSSIGNESGQVHKQTKTKAQRGAAKSKRCDLIDEKNKLNDIDC